MEINLPFSLKENTSVILRRCGYAEFHDPNTNQVSYTRRLTQDYYPRFHLYPQKKDGKIFLNIHLDQKKPSYAGAHSHNAEYQGEVIEKEVVRIEGLIKNQLNNQVQETKPAKKSFFDKLFGDKL